MSGQGSDMRHSQAPYNFIGLEDFVLDRCGDEKEILMHERYHEGLNTGAVRYEIKVLTPLSITNGSRGNSNSQEISKNPMGSYIIPGNTIRGLTRYNASIFSFASVKNEQKEKYDIKNRRFYYRTFASRDKNMKGWYSKSVGTKPGTVDGRRRIILERVQAGYIRKKGDEYIITPSVKIKNVDGGFERSYTPIHENDLREGNIRGINYMYTKKIEKVKHPKNSNPYYTPYFKEVRYNTDGKKVNIDINGKFEGMLANSNFISGKRHHYLIHEEDKDSAQIVVSKRLAELYEDDLEYTHKLNAAKNQIAEGCKYYSLPKGDEVKPIFYITGGEELNFGFTPYLRLPAEGDIYGGLPKSHKDYEGTDFVDAIFGWKSFRTKLSFRDAICEELDGRPIEKYSVVLAEPKASWYRGYLKQRGGNSLESYNDENYKIRGRKFYWMKKKLDIGSENKYKNDSIVSDMECYPEGTKFAGKIKFENLTDEELGLLLYSLKQGDTEGYFNLGKGKPYGFGKCKIRITGFMLEDIKKKYSSFSANYQKSGETDNFIDAFKSYIIKNYRKKVDNVNEIEAYRQFTLSKNILEKTDVSYMDVKEFANRGSLPNIDDIVNREGNRPVRRPRGGNPRKKNYGGSQKRKPKPSGASKDKGNISQSISKKDINKLMELKQQLESEG
ncbi:MAG: TIGR03986 family CRISPR-associated RAMP protein [Clostridium sp.]|nr:TIGR03986 family CRISPR-associated RAMP protein [Clostridium sp.]